MARADIEPEDITAVCDTREQLPLSLSPLKVIRGTLPTGDYSVAGLEHLIAIERKSLDDLIGCVGVGRDRFDREMQRMISYETRAIVVESGWPDLEAGLWRSRVTPSAAMGSVLGWVAMGVPVIMAGNRERADRCVARMLYIAARRRWREIRSMCDELRIAT